MNTWPPRPPGGGNGQPPDLREVLRKGEDFFGRGGGWGVLGGAAGILLAAILAFGSFYTIAPEQMGVVLRFGAVQRTTEPGPHFKIPLIETVLKPEVTKVHRLEIGFRTVDPGPPARYTSVAEEAHMLTGDENIISIEFIVQFKIKDPIDFLFNVREQGKTIKDAAEAAMREVIGRTPIDNVLTEGRFEVQEETMALLQAILDRYATGILVVAVQLQDVLPPEPVSAAFKDVASAREDRERAVEQAEGYRNDIIPRAKGQAEELISAAEGYRQQQINQAEGETSRFLSVLKEYRRARDVTRKRIYVDTMTEVLGRTENIILDGAAAENVLPYLPLERPLKPAKTGGTP